jgi:hypothetical protein
MLHLFLELFLRFLILFRDSVFGKIDRVNFLTLQSLLLLDTLCHELIHIPFVLDTVLYWTWKVSNSLGSDFMIINTINSSCMGDLRYLFIFVTMEIIFWMNVLTPFPSYLALTNSVIKEHTYALEDPLKWEAIFSRYSFVVSQSRIAPLIGSLMRLLMMIKHLVLDLSHLTLSML